MASQLQWIVGPTSKLVAFVNSNLKDKPPAHIIVLTAGASFLVSYLYQQWTHRVPWHIRMKKYFFKWMRKIPSVRDQIESETEKVRQGFEKELLEPTIEIEEFLHHRLPLLWERQIFHFWVFLVIHRHANHLSRCCVLAEI